jgi:hypothetical protein
MKGVRPPPLSKIMRFDRAAIVLVAALLAYQTARAEEPLHIPSGGGRPKVTKCMGPVVGTGAVLTLATVNESARGT